MNKWHLRFAVTSNCNFNCKYCSTNQKRNPELNDNEIKEMLLAAKRSGIEKVHWTGGEPLVKRNLEDYIAYANEIGFKHQSITTNGYLLKRQAKKLIKSGINRFNISLDTLKKDRFKQITEIDGLNKVLEGIEEVLENSDCDIKINMVVMRENLEEINKFIQLAKEANKKYERKRMIIRFLQFFPCNPNQLQENGQEYWKKQYVSEQEIIEEIEKENKLNSLENEKIQGDNPTMKYFKVDDYTIVGILAMFSWKYSCGNCHKLRITPYGYASCCLNDEETYLLTGKTLEEKEQIIKGVIERRNTVIEARTDRKHYRKKLGELRFGEKGNEMQVDEFYKIMEEMEIKNG